MKGINPNINYFINGNSDFTIIGGYIFMTKDLPEATLSLQVSLQYIVLRILYIVCVIIQVGKFLIIRHFKF